MKLSNYLKSASGCGCGSSSICRHGDSTCLLMAGHKNSLLLTQENQFIIILFILIIIFLVLFSHTPHTAGVWTTLLPPPLYPFTPSILTKFNFWKRFEKRRKNSFSKSVIRNAVCTRAHTGLISTTDKVLVLFLDCRLKRVPSSLCDRNTFPLGTQFSWRRNIERLQLLFEKIFLAF